ncbi:hypothetical protein BV25DRAFT_1902161 [Artomyces pyxidatus]|uniref:Uncharacterized protein n=1 Tax=Artomyces pyxidatus TaxID=48021 RepID=A0ACB8SR70_9AGAM|nr:hypothetical protein BV25DRAFT_1902161 [Artomyces pyxidatus]
MLSFCRLLPACVLFPVLAQAQQTLFPAAVPLAIRSPYFSCWEPTTKGTIFGRAWPTFFTGPVLGWAGLAKIDDVPYSWLGNDGSAPWNVTNLTGMTITPTRSIFSVQAGPVELTITFLSPIEPGDWVRQSMPFSYLYVDAKSLDGNAHRIQLYTDLTGEWSSGDRNALLTWTSSVTQSTVYHAVNVQTPAPFQEDNQQAQWGTLYLAMNKTTGVTYMTASAGTARKQFASQGVLNDELDTTFRSIPDGYPVFAIAQDLGTIQSTTSPAVWVIGYSRDPALQYTPLSGATQQRNLYFMSKYKAGDSTGLINDFLADFPDAVARAGQLDTKITGDAANVSSDYADLVSLAARQAYGGTELTIAKGSDGSFNTSDVMMFMKNIGGLVRNRVNAVETLFASFPMFMSIDPTLGSPLLEPLLRSQDSLDYQVGYAAADLGSQYPNVTLSNQPHQQGVEQSGNMLIMTYAYARASGDGSIIARYYHLLKTWSDYLVDNTLFVDNQLSADNQSVNNQTNLAIKGIIAIQAMSSMSSVLNNTADSLSYAGKAASLFGQWKSLALASDNHVLAVYGQSSSWSLGYNLFADRWLGTNLLDSSAFDGQTQFLSNIASSNANVTLYGTPIDSFTIGSTTSTWDIFTSAFMTDPNVRNNLISSVHNRASLNATAGAFPLSYNSSSGATIHGGASPAQGAMFAALALNVPVATIQANFTSPDAPSPSASGIYSSKPTKSKVSIRAIVGGTLGALALIAALFAFLWYRIRRHGGLAHVISPDKLDGNSPPDPSLTPFAVQDNAEYQPMLTPLAHNMYEMAGASRSTSYTAGSRLIDSDTDLRRMSPLSVPPLPLMSQSPPSDKALARLRQLNAAAHRRPDIQGSSSGPSAPVAGSGSGSQHAGVDLRNEVEILRQEVERMRAERPEPPPSYAGPDTDVSWTVA